MLECSHRNPGLANENLKVQFQTGLKIQLYNMLIYFLIMSGFTDHKNKNKPKISPWFRETFAHVASDISAKRPRWKCASPIYKAETCQDGKKVSGINCALTLHSNYGAEFFHVKHNPWFDIMTECSHNFKLKIIWSLKKWSWTQPFQSIKCDLNWIAVITTK